MVDLEVTVGTVATLDTHAHTRTHPWLDGSLTLPSKPKSLRITTHGSGIRPRACCLPFLNYPRVRRISHRMTSDHDITFQHQHSLPWLHRPHNIFFITGIHLSIPPPARLSRLGVWYCLLLAPVYHLKTRDYPFVDGTAWSVLVPHPRLLASASRPSLLVGSAVCCSRGRVPRMCLAASAIGSGLDLLLDELISCFRFSARRTLGTEGAVFSSGGCSLPPSFLGLGSSFEWRQRRY